MKKRLVIRDIFLFLIIVLNFFFVGRTLYALVKVQGIGLYLAMSRGGERTNYDMLVVMLVVIALFLTLVGPFILLRHRKVASFFRLMAVHLAFVPVLNLPQIVHMFDGQNLLVIECNVESNQNLWRGFPKEVVPVMVLLAGFYLCKGHVIKKWHKILLIMTFVLAVAVLFLPELQDAMLPWIAYLLVLVAFDWWEEVFAAEKERYETVLLWLMFAVFFTRGCYRMLEIISAYPIV